MRSPRCSTSSYRWYPLLLVSVLGVGCAADGSVWGLQRPLLTRPGPIDYQRNIANLHDPYPDPDAGPDMGIRPREFDKPLAEPVRNRYLQNNWWQR